MLAHTGATPEALGDVFDASAGKGIVPSPRSYRVLPQDHTAAEIGTAGDRGPGFLDDIGSPDISPSGATSVATISNS